MNRINFTSKLLALILSIAFIISFMGCQNNEQEENIEESLKLQPMEPIVTNIYTADPSVHIFNNKLYIYPSHDPDEMGDPTASTDDGGHYQMVDYHVLSIDSFDGTCTDHGVALQLDDIPWAYKQLWAPDAAFKNDIYYFYFPAKDNEDIFRIGVATSSNPEGPFTAEPNYIDGSFSMDPALFVDTDNQAYMVFGGIWGGQLEHWQTGEYLANPTEPGLSDNALGPMIAPMSEDMLSFTSKPKEISILDKEGNPILAGDEQRRFFEAAWIHKYQDKYYLSYSTGSTHYVVYAISDSIEGSYTYQGQILAPVLGWTTHHSIVEFEGKWYLFYHDASLSGGLDHKRSVKYVELKYNEDGTIKTINP